MRIGLIGTGLMGRPMAERIIAAGHQLIAYNRTRARVEPLAESGAEIADTVEQLIDSADLIILMLSDATAIRDTILTPDTIGKLPNHTVIQMSTIAPSESEQFHDQIVQIGGSYLEAPVLGSIPEAQSGRLIVMVGSSEEQFEKFLPVLKIFGVNPMRIGAVGQAAALKLALNQLIAGLTASFSVSLGFLQQRGVSIDQFMQILRDSALYAPTFDKKLTRFLARDYAKPNFPTKHLAKDINLLLQESQASARDTTLLATLLALLNQTIDQGLGDADYSALFESINPEESSQ